MTKPLVVFNKPVVLESALEKIKQALESGHLSGMGHFTREVENKLSRLNKTKNLLTTSATHSLEMMAILLKFKNEEEIIIPSFTFVTSALAFYMHGAKIKFCDVDENGQLDLKDLQKKISSKTKAVLVVHYAGFSCDLQKLMAICEERNLILLEDAAQSIGSEYLGRPLGTFGRLGCYSFHETKNISAGEGGGLLVNQEKDLADLYCIREKGTNRREFEENIVKKYSWVSLGSSYVLSELNAAFLDSQLDVFEDIQKEREKTWNYYKSNLEESLLILKARILSPPVYNKPNFHIFAIVFQMQSQRDLFISSMREKGILCPFHYVPLHNSPFSIKNITQTEDCPQSIQLSNTLVRLPLYYGMKTEIKEYVVKNSLETFSSLSPKM